MLHGFLFLLNIVQQSGGWQLDLVSFLLGLVLGAVIALLVYRSLPSILEWRDRVINRIRETHAWVRSGVEVRFQAETAEYVHRYHLEGHRASLEEVFVPPRLLLPPEEFAPENAYDLAPARLHYLWPELAARSALAPMPGATIRQVLLNGQRVFITAPPGYGKTTLLAYCAHACAQATDMGPYTFLLPKLPLFIHLEELDFTLPETPEEGGEVIDPNPVAPLARALSRRSSPLTARGLGDLLQQKIGEGNVILLLDGWDELFPDRRQEATDWLRRLLIAFPDTQIIMTAPTNGYGPLLDLDFTALGLLSWRVGQAEQFGRQWVKALQSSRRLPLNTFWQPGRSPLESMLRLSLAVGDDDAIPAELPRRKIELMEANLRRLLPRFDQENDPPWLAPATRELWQQLAYEMLRGEQSSISQEQVVEIIDRILTEYEALEDRGAAQRLLDTLTSSDLFIRLVNRRTAILSPVWRDFLAGSHMGLAQMHEEALERLHDPQWSGTLDFFVGRVGADELAPRLLESTAGDPLQDNLFRATRWLPETVSPAMSASGEWRRQVLIRLGQLIVKNNLPLTLRQRAVLAMAQTGENGVLTFVRQILRQSDHNMRQAALAALPGLGAELAIDVLQKMFDDGEPRVRSAATYALSWINDPAAENPLLTALIEPDEPLSRAASIGLALNGDEHAFEVLREATAEEALHLRRSAVYGLSLLDQYWAVELLDQLEREDEQWVVKSAAGDALQEIVSRNKEAPWRAPTPGEQGWLIRWAAEQERGVPGGAAAVPVILEALRDPDDPAVRVAAAVTFGRLAIREARTELQAALRDPNSVVREAAFIALIRIGLAWDLPLLGAAEK